MNIHYETVKTPPQVQYEGYPSTRLVVSEKVPSDVFLPEGPWHVGDVSDRPTPVLLPTTEQIEVFRQQGLEVDMLGRPLHPLIKRMLANKALGVVTGNGALWNYGPNQAADILPVAGKRSPYVALIERKDGGGIATAGGFANSGELSQTTALREGGEELGKIIQLAMRLAISRDSHSIQQVYSDIVTGDRRSTAHSWIHTEAFVARIPFRVPLTAGDDAVAARWYRLDRLPEGISPAHVPILQAAQEHILG